MLDALPEPKPLPWTHQGCWYGRNWGRQYLRVTLLRAAGQHDLAATAHAANLADPEYREHTAALDIAPCSPLPAPSVTNPT